MKYAFLTAALLCCVTAFSQDTTLEKWTFKKTISYWGKWQTYAPDAGVKMPAVIKRSRQSSAQLPVRFDTVTDNPLRHGATYVALHTQSGYRNKVFLFADVYGEHRGVSYGLYDRNNTLLYPVLRIEAKDTLRFFSKVVELSGKTGQFLDERLDEGLTIYNIDVQGIQLRARLKNIEFQATLYGDLSNGIGLNVDDLVAHSVRRQFSDRNNYIGLSWVIAYPPYAPLKNFYSLNFFGRKSGKDRAVYFQLGYRPFSDDFFKKQTVFDHAAFVAGASTQYEGKRFRYETAVELRHYGWLFNALHSDARVRYRMPASNVVEMYANTVGNYLYPLRKFSTPFSQWAVFTEYAGFTVNAVTLQGKSAYLFSRKAECGLAYDFNLIQGRLNDFFSVQPNESRSTSFLYPFFEGSFSYLPAENFNVSLFLSNKAMNLDVSYPTHYLLARPTVGLSVKANF